MTYFRNPLRNYYRQRWYVSRLCSEWEEVVPYRFNNRLLYFYQKYLQKSTCQPRLTRRNGKNLLLEGEEKFRRTGIFRSISTARLNPLQGFHRPPINQVIFLGSFPLRIGGEGFLILGTASRLRCFQRLS